MEKYGEKLEPILNDIENKEAEIAGGSVVGMVISITDSLIDYICNLTIGKQKYANVENEVIKIKKEAQKLRKEALNSIDQDKEVLSDILLVYKTRKENPEQYEKTNKKAVEFCVDVTKTALETLKLADRISKVGNKMLASDFEICKYYSFASIKASIVNIEINLSAIKDEEYVQKIKERYNKYYEEAEEIM